MENPDRQSYNNNLALKKTKLHLNSMDHFDTLVKSKLTKFATNLVLFKRELFFYRIASRCQYNPDLVFVCFAIQLRSSINSQIKISFLFLSFYLETQTKEKGTGGNPIKKI